MTVALGASVSTASRANWKVRSLWSPQKDNQVSPSGSRRSPRTLQVNRSPATGVRPKADSGRLVPSVVCEPLNSSVSTRWTVQRTGASGRSPEGAQASIGSATGSSVSPSSGEKPVGFR